MTRRSFAPLFWLLAQVGSRVRLTPSVTTHLASSSGPVETLTAPTRHGACRVLVVRPPREAARPGAGLPPILVQLHGGGFLNRYPEQDRFIARHLSSGTGAVVLIPDYATAPAARYPVAEEQMHDVVEWVHGVGDTHGWDGSRLLLSGISAGAKLAVNICQQAETAGGQRPLGVSLIVPVTDMSRADRESAANRPAISPFVQRLVQWAYFPDAERRREPLAAPRFDPTIVAAMPPTLIQTAELDTLAAEGRELADTLAAGGVRVRFREHPGADHGFYAEKPASRVEDVFTEVVVFLRSCLPSEV